MLSVLLGEIERGELSLGKRERKHAPSRDVLVEEATPIRHTKRVASRGKMGERITTIAVKTS